MNDYYIHGKFLLEPTIVDKNDSSKLMCPFKISEKRCHLVTAVVMQELYNARQNMSHGLNLID